MTLVRPRLLKSGRKLVKKTENVTVKVTKSVAGDWASKVGVLRTD